MISKLIKNVDFNCSMANAFKNDDLNNSFELMEYMSSVNIACGINSGDPLLIKRAIEHCKFKNKVIGALIGLPQNITDVSNLTEEDVEALVLYQLGALSSFAKAYSLNIEQVRPDGLMYKFASEDFDFAIKIAKAVKKYSEWFILIGAAGEILEKVGQEVGINIAHEVILDKQYNETIINYDLTEINDEGLLLARLNNLLKLSKLDENSSDEFLKIDTIHFSKNVSNQFFKESANIIIPRPVNYNKTVTSGWVE